MSITSGVNFFKLESERDPPDHCCERCGEPSDDLSDDLVCFDCYELAADAAFEQAREAQWDLE